MLRPQNLLPEKYGIALGPLKGSEKKLKISTLPTFELAELRVTAANTADVLSSVPDNLALATRPSELVCVLRTNINGGSSPVNVFIVGTDTTGAALSGQYKFTPPQYAQDQTEVMPEGWGVDLLSGQAKFKIVTGYSITCEAAAVGGRIRVFALPDLSTFNLIGYRVRLDYNPGVREPSPTQDGSDMSGYIKPGDRPVKTFNITGKCPTHADGIARYNGMPVTGWAYEDKEDVLITSHEFFMRLIITVKQTHPEGAAAGDDSILEGTGLYKDYALLLAQ